MAVFSVVQSDLWTGGVALRLMNGNQHLCENDWTGIGKWRVSKYCWTLKDMYESQKPIKDEIIKLKEN